ncbi:hypothetical protein QBC43DRAFT_6341 [Cladorrhinum sp. PSN259]|nr:hypothetical protein QBC43DRAFT_6341 [Cladorrhinum sp. PSN259]
MGAYTSMDMVSRRRKLFFWGRCSSLILVVVLLGLVLKNAHWQKVLFLLCPISAVLLFCCSAVLLFYSELGAGKR